MTAFDPGEPYRLHPRVALRREVFGALAYHYETRRLAFLKSRALVDAVCALEDHPSVASLLDTLGLSPAKRRVMERSLAQLADLGVICPAPQDPR